MAPEKWVLPLMVLTRMGPRNERGSWTCMEPLEERVESLRARRTSPFDDFVSCNLVLTVPLLDCVWITINFEAFFFE